MTLYFDLTFETTFVFDVKFQPRTIIQFVIYPDFRVFVGKEVCSNSNIMTNEIHLVEFNIILCYKYILV